jgi:hypothetical protein
MIPRSTTITPEGRRIRAALLGAAGLIVIVNLLVWVLGNLTDSERVSGPDGSSYVTTAYGTAALAELFDSEGITVIRMRSPYNSSRLRPDQALLLVEAGFAEFADSELEAVTGLLQEGGRLVLAGPVPDHLLDVLGADLPVWQVGGPTSSIATAALPGVDEVPLSGGASFSGTGRTTPVLVGDEGTPVGVSWEVGRGSVVWLADSAPLLNLGLALGDSAGLAVALLDGQAAVFDEYRHGFGGDSFWQALPDGWAATLLLLAVAGLAGMIAYARRLGPPEDLERRLRPDRAAYIESVAAMLGRTRRLNESIRPVRARTRRLLATRAGLGQEPSDDALRRAGLAANLSSDEIEAVLDETGDPIAAGRALTRLSQEPGEPLP